MLISIFLVCIIFILVDLIPIYKNKQWWTFWVYSSMIAFVCVITLLITVGVKIPSPAIPIGKIVSAIYGIE